MAILLDIFVIFLYFYNKGGFMPKPKYEYWLKEENLQKIQEWALKGLTNEQIASNMGIALSSFYDWCNKHSELLDALKTTKEFADIQIENALYKRATGYTIQLQKQKVTKDGEIVTYFDEQHVAPDTTAQIFWLKNRKPTIWRDKVEQGISLDTPLGVIIENEFRKPEEMPTEETN